MTQYYMGVKQVEAWPSDNDGKAGYVVKYPDGYQSWCPKDVFEAAYLPMGYLGEKNGGNGVEKIVNSNTVTQEMVDDFIDDVRVQTIGEKTTLVQARLMNGFEITESSSCVDPANYSQELGVEICMERIRSQVWHLLGFTLQWARAGLHSS